MLARSFFVALIAGAAGCGGGARQSPARAETHTPPAGPERIALRYDQHLPTLPVRLDGELDTRFAFDTGIGINLVSKRLCKMLGCAAAGTFTGKRMSGQAITVPLARLRSLAVGREVQRDVVVGVIDIEAFGEAPDLQGFLSLGFFAERAVTLDERRGELVLEDAASVERRLASGVAVPIDVRREGPSLTVFLPLEISGHAVNAEVDTGSDALILDERFMTTLGVDKAGAKAVEGRDETGQPYTRWFAELSADVFPVRAPAVRRKGLRTMFQAIIYDGLVGRRFLEPWAVTFDVPRQRMVFGGSEDAQGKMRL
jgi:hypothetical protein